MDTIRNLPYRKKSNFLSVYTNDIINAAREILNRKPFVTKRRTIQMMQHLMVALENKVRVIESYGMGVSIF